MELIAPGTTIIFDFTTNTIIAAGSSPDADQRFRDFIARQQATASASAPAAG